MAENEEACSADKPAVMFPRLPSKSATCGVERRPQKTLEENENLHHERRSQKKAKIEAASKKRRRSVNHQRRRKLKATLAIEEAWPFCRRSGLKKCEAALGFSREEKKRKLSFGRWKLANIQQSLLLMVTSQASQAINLVQKKKRMRLRRLNFVTRRRTIFGAGWSAAWLRRLLAWPVKKRSSAENRPRERKLAGWNSRKYDGPITSTWKAV